MKERKDSGINKKSMMRQQIYIYMLIMALTVMACDAVDNEDLQGGHMISLDFVNSSLSEVEFGSDLQYKIIFYKADNANISASKEVKYNDLCYVAEEAWMSFDEFKKYQFSISNYNLNEYVYQIVVLAKANDRDEYVYDTTDKNEDGICSMDELRILRNYTPDGTVIPLTMSNYIGHQLLTDEIVKNGIVEIRFEPLVGQLIFDVGRYAADGKTNIPLDWGINSTLDRVCRIKFSIKNSTHSFCPYATKESVQSSPIIDSSFIEVADYDFSGYLNGLFQLDSEKLQNAPVDSAGVLSANKSQDVVPLIPVGTTRIYGPYQFATETAEVQMANGAKYSMEIMFYYHDTFINNSPIDSVSLDMPRKDVYMSIVPNSYTYSKIKIRENRIIDVSKDFGSITIDNSWYD